MLIVSHPNSSNNTQYNTTDRYLLIVPVKYFECFWSHISLKNKLSCYQTNLVLWVCFVPSVSCVESCYGEFFRVILNLILPLKFYCMTHVTPVMKVFIGTGFLIWWRWDYIFLIFTFGAHDLVVRSPPGPWHARALPTMLKLGVAQEHKNQGV